MGVDDLGCIRPTTERQSQIRTAHIILNSLSSTYANCVCIRHSLKLCNAYYVSFSMPCIIIMPLLWLLADS